MELMKALILGSGSSFPLELFLELSVLMMTFVYVMRLVIFLATSNLSGSDAQELPLFQREKLSAVLASKVLRAPVRSLVGVGATLSLPKRSLRSQRFR